MIPPPMKSIFLSILTAMPGLLIPPGLHAAGPGESAPIPDFTCGDRIPEKAAHDWNLGPTGAEAADGALILRRWREGKTESVTVKIAVLGAYAPTAPFACGKSKRVLEQGCESLRGRRGGSGRRPSHNKVVERARAPRPRRRNHGARTGRGHREKFAAAPLLHRQGLRAVWRPSPWLETHDDNGKCGAGAVMFDLLGNARGAEFFSRMTTASYGCERDLGHTGNFFNLLWAMPGVARSGPQATGAWMREFAWYYDLARRWDGTFVYQGEPMAIEDNKYRTGTATGAYLLAYAMPLRKIYLTGKKPGARAAAFRRRRAGGHRRRTRLESSQEGRGLRNTSIRNSWPA